MGLSGLDLGAKQVLAMALLEKKRRLEAKGDGVEAVSRPSNAGALQQCLRWRGWRWEITRIIGCDALDTVRVGKRRELIMFVDDTGMIDGKAVIPMAIELYRAICKPGTLHSIHGDVVIVPAGGLA